MKRLTLVLAVVACMAFGSEAIAQVKPVTPVKAQQKPLSKLNWLNPVVDLGKVTQNTPVTAKFEFVNIGTVPVIITNVRTSCGCTGKNYSKEPIAPGATSVVEATYDAKAIGSFSKSVTVTTNEGSNPKVLRLKGHVSPK